MTLDRMGDVRWTVALMVALLAASEGYRILAVFPIPGKSHSLLGEGHVKLLLERGHEVTYITPFPMKIKSENLTQVQLASDTWTVEDLANETSFDTLLKGSSNFPKSIQFLGYELARLALNDSNMQKLMMNPEKKFDIVLAEWFYTEIYAGFAALYECPLVWFSSLPLHSMILRVIDELPNPAYTADALSTSKPPLNFSQRVVELWNTIFRTLTYEFYLTPKTGQIYKNVFGAAAAKRGVELPPYNELIYNSSLILINGHFSLGEAPKLPQNVKEIGGYHIDTKTEPQPKDLQKILDDAKHGVIYFSMGSSIRTADMPADLKIDLLNMLGELKQTVLWKFEENIEGLPSNVHIKRWIPQHSVLAHPNTKLFITHGGVSSITETVHFGVPIIVIPMFGDQFLNADKAVKKGFAVPVKFTYSLASDLRAAIQESLGNPRYSARVKQLSAIYHDRPLSPADELLYWIEYTARTGGAPHLRSPALQLTWYQKLYLDLFVLVLFAFLIMRY